MAPQHQQADVGARRERDAAGRAGTGSGRTGAKLCSFPTLAIAVIHQRPRSPDIFVSKGMNARKLGKKEVPT